MNTELLNDLVEECNAALQVSIPEGREAINATARMIEGLFFVMINLSIEMISLKRSFSH